MTRKEIRIGLGVLAVLAVVLMVAPKALSEDPAPVRHGSIFGIARRLSLVRFPASAGVSASALCGRGGMLSKRRSAAWAPGARGSAFVPES